MTADDVAAQLARERALKQAEKMETIGRLTGAIAQQFNELLTAILARTAALARSLPSNNDLDELRLTAQRGTENPSTRQIAPGTATRSRLRARAARLVTWRPRASIPRTQRTVTATPAAARTTRG